MISKGNVVDMAVGVIIGGAKAKLERKKEEVPAEPKPEEPAPETELDVLKEIRALLSDKGSADK